MASKRLEELSIQLAALRTHLLPDPFEATGQYANQEQVETLAIAYRMLSHAEIEAYFEDRALEAATCARIAWTDAKYVSRVALCLLAFSGKEMVGPPPSLEAPGDNKRKSWPALIDVGERLGPVFAEFFHFVRNENHGIKERNLLALLLPIGIEHSHLDPAFLTDIDSFGSLRGIAAHSSSRQSVRQAVNPAEELRRVEALISGIASLDSVIDRLMGDIPTPNSPAKPQVADSGT